MKLIRSHNRGPRARARRRGPRIVRAISRAHRRESGVHSPVNSLFLAIPPRYLNATGSPFTRPDFRRLKWKDGPSGPPFSDREGGGRVLNDYLFFSSNRTSSSAIRSRTDRKAITQERWEWLKEDATRVHLFYFIKKWRTRWKIAILEIGTGRDAFSVLRECLRT